MVELPRRERQGQQGRAASQGEAEVRAVVPVAEYNCYRTAGHTLVHGKLDEPSWPAAPRSTPFVDIVTGEAAWFDTRVALLWDDDYLYFGFRAEETDVWATLTERDSKIYEENDLEIFIAGQDAYYEFEINALNTIYEVFWIWKDIFKPNPEFDPATQRTMVLDGVGGHVHPRGERWGFLDWDFPGLRHAVHVDGTLKHGTRGTQGIRGTRDVDRDWTVEVALPWRGLELLADGRSLPPKDGDVWRVDGSRFEQIGRNGEGLDPCVGWSWSQPGHY